MRTALRTAVTTALLAGLAVTPALTAGTAFAADGPTATTGTGTPGPAEPKKAEATDEPEQAESTDRPKADQPVKGDQPATGEPKAGLPVTEEQPVKEEQKPAPAAGTVLSGPTVRGCTVTETIASVFPYWTVTLTHDVKAGPRAVLKDAKGAVLAAVDRGHPADVANGLKIKGADTAAPVFGQHSNGGASAPYQWTDFPKLPKGCATAPTATPTTTATATPAPAPATGTQGGQTTVVPKGGVAAGAEFGTVEQGNDTALLASGAGAAAVVAAGLGFTAMRRRTATARD
ncbi:hypothetical protein AB0A60_02570 [Streptomyces sp. NPDC046275]|uniref:hypothetical protein n=1 Tax=Streptomyces sp. NPDC046275 TaxID=3157201 RepID=UPI003406E2DB